MSPSESQLRAALHEGEGEGLDAGLLIAHGNRLRRQRRRRINQIAVATVVVGVVGVGFTVLSGNGSNDEAGSSTSGGSAALQRSSAPAGGSAGGGGAHAAPPHRGQTAPSAAASGNYSFVGGCPSVPTHIALPTGVTQDEASGPLLPSDASAIRACGYPGGTRSQTLVLQSTRASALAATINSAPITPSRTVRICTKNQLTGTVELLAVDGAGRRSKPVVITIASPNAVATNGMATRYFAVAPPVLRNLLR